MKTLKVFVLIFLTLGFFQNCSDAAFTANQSSGANGGAGDNDAIGELFQTFNTLQPAMAVRSANCINCHGNTMASSLITDFGYGDSYFFGRNNASPVSGDWVYSLRID